MCWVVKQTLSETLLKSTDNANTTIKITKPNITIKVIDENGMSVTENIIVEVSYVYNCFWTFSLI